MTKLIVISSFFASVLYLFWALKALVRIKRFSLLILTNLFVVLRAGPGLALSYFFPNLWPVYFTDIAVVRGALAIIFISLFSLLFQALLLKVSRQSRFKENQSISKNVLLLLGGFVFFALAALGQVYFLIIKGNISYFAEAVVKFADPDTHYLYREYITQSLYAAGKGQFASYLSLFLFGPLATVLFAICQIQFRRRSFSFFWKTIIILEIISAIIHGHRSPIVFYILFGIVITYFAKKGNDFEKWILGKRPGWKIMWLALIALSVSTLIYMLTNRVKFSGGLALALWRIFVVTSVAPLYFYELFPEYFGFRGLYGTFFIGDRFNPNADLTYADLGRVLQGVSFNPNAAYFAVAYSGLGFAGIILVVVLVNFLCLVVDLIALRVNPVVRSGIILISLNAIQTLVSDHLMFAVMGHGFILTPFIVLALDRIGQRHLNRFGRESLPGRNSSFAGKTDYQWRV